MDTWRYTLPIERIKITTSNITTRNSSNAITFNSDYQYIKSGGGQFVTGGQLSAPIFIGHVDQGGSYVNNYQNYSGLQVTGVDSGNLAVGTGFTLSLPKCDELFLSAGAKFTWYTSGSPSLIFELRWPIPLSYDFSTSTEWGTSYPSGVGSRAARHWTPEASITHNGTIVGYYRYYALLFEVYNDYYGYSSYVAFTFIGPPRFVGSLDTWRSGKTLVFNSPGYIDRLGTVNMRYLENWYYMEESTKIMPAHIFSRQATQTLSLAITP